MLTIDISRLLEDYGDSLFRYAMIRLRDVATAEDLVQETFLAAIQGADRFNMSSSVGTWLTGILKHKIIDHYRRSRFLVDVSHDDAEFFDESGHWREESTPEIWNRFTPEDDMEKRQLAEVLHNALASIPPQLATVFVLHEVEGLSRDEICELLGVSDSNYWVILHRARLRLRWEVERRWNITTTARSGFDHVLQPTAY